MPKRPKAIVVAPRNNRFDPEDPAHYSAAYLERLAQCGRAVATAKRDSGTGEVQASVYASRFSLTIAEVQGVISLVDAAFHDHAHGRRLLPYTSPRRESPPKPPDPLGRGRPPGPQRD